MERLPASYLHGTEPEEQRRLSCLNDLINEESLRVMGLAPGQRVLDVGCGLAQLTRWMARTVQPGGSVVGIERSAEQIREARRQAAEAGEEAEVEIRQGPADELPLAEGEWGSFDVVHARFLLEHVARPEEVVAAMVRAARPGGRIILEDDDHDLLRLWPEPEGFSAVWEAYQRSFVALGCDPAVGRRLVSLLHGAGAAPLRNHWLFFGACSGDPNFPAMVRNFVGILRGAQREIVPRGLLDAAVFDAGVEALERWGERPDAALWYGRAWAEGRRP